ncbi:hypothetical protein [Massilia sp. SYSU DXS3249]
MDEVVKRFAWLLLLMCGAAGAQALPDPTRPPAALQARPEGAPAAAAEQRAPQLQSVLIARQPGGRHVAVIDGETVRLGELFQGARVTRIEQNEVELVRGRVRQVLRLHPPPAAGMRGAGRAGNQ